MAVGGRGWIKGRGKGALGDNKEVQVANKCHDKIIQQT